MRDPRHRTGYLACTAMCSLMRRGKHLSLGYLTGVAESRDWDGGPVRLMRPYPPVARDPVPVRRLCLMTDLCYFVTVNRPYLYWFYCGLSLLVCWRLVFLLSCCWLMCFLSCLVLSNGIGVLIHLLSFYFDVILWVMSGPLQ